MSMTMANTETTDEGIDWARFESVGIAGKVRCRECGMTGFPPQVYFGVVYPWWGTRHQQSHPWDCSKCDRAFTTPTGLSTHQRSAHGIRSAAPVPIR